MNLSGLLEGLKMAGMNKSYHLKMKDELYKKLKKRADEEGIDLSVLIRTFLWERIRQEENRVFELSKISKNSTKQP